MFKEIVKRTLRVPLNGLAPDGDASLVVTGLDSLLISNGFKLSPELFIELSKMDADDCTFLSKNILAAVEELIGSHVKHNVYFKEFPKHVPNTEKFWADCIVDALHTPEIADEILLQLSIGRINLLDLPKYGKYLHSYEDMVAVHKAYIEICKNVKILQISGTIQEEIEKLYLSIAGSKIPISEGDRKFLSDLAIQCLNTKIDSIPMKENCAIINAVRIGECAPIIADTVTDVLRLACHLSDGDVTLATNTKFKSFPRTHRRTMLSALHNIVKNNPEKLSDVNPYAEQWKRLFERLHPWEFKSRFPGATRVHECAMGINKVRSITSRIEELLKSGDFENAVGLYKSAPGLLYRNLDRLLRIEGLDNDIVTKAVSDTVEKIPARILFGIREHLQNRLQTASERIFTNTKGKTWVTGDKRKQLPDEIARIVMTTIDVELASRLPDIPNVVIDSAMLTVALPKSNKGMEKGIGMMPRGSKMPICTDGELLWFFMYWKEKSERTDYDLSAQYLDKNFVYSGHASYTDLKGDGYKHSGDITSAPDGASEFIRINLDKVNADYIVPQMLVYSGENFDEVEESFFGYMERKAKTDGLPFEPTAVTTKSEIRGVGKVAIPLTFAKQADGSWMVYWMQMYLKGSPSFNRVEATKISTSMLAKAIVSREYLYVSYIADLFKMKNIEVSDKIGYGPVVYIGLNAPETLPEGSVTYTLTNLHELVNLFEIVS